MAQGDSTMFTAVTVAAVGAATKVVTIPSGATRARVFSDAACYFHVTGLTAATAGAYIPANVWVADFPVGAISTTLTLTKVATGNLGIISVVFEA